MLRSENGHCCVPTHLLLPRNFDQLCVCNTQRQRHKPLQRAEPRALLPAVFCGIPGHVETDGPSGWHKPGVVLPVDSQPLWKRPHPPMTTFTDAIR